MAICENWKESQHPPLDFTKISTENPACFCLAPPADCIWYQFCKWMGGRDVDRSFTCFLNWVIVFLLLSCTRSLYALDSYQIRDL